MSPCGIWKLWPPGIRPRKVGILKYIGDIGVSDVMVKYLWAKLLDHIPLNCAVIPPKPSGRALGEGLVRVEIEHELRLYALGGVVA